MQRAKKLFNWWPILGCALVLMTLMLFQNSLLMSDAMHQQAEVGIALFSLGLVHIVGGEIAAKIAQHRDGTDDRR